MEEKIHEIAPYARLVRLSEPPVIGAVLIAMLENGVQPSKSVRDNLSSSLEFLRNDLVKS